MASWSEFERYVWNGWWRRQFAPSRGWESEHGKKLLGGRYIVDLAAWKGNRRAVGDAKDRGRLSNDDVEKLIEDAGAYRAERAILLIAADTNIPEAVHRYAEDNDVEIIRTRWRG